MAGNGDRGAAQEKEMEAQPTMMMHPDMQAISWVLEVQHQQAAQQQEWLQHKVSSFRMPKMTKDDGPESYLESSECTVMQAMLE